DAVVGALLTFLDEQVGKGRYAVVLTADHGVCPIPEQKKIPTAARVMHANVINELKAVLSEKYGANRKWFETDEPGVWADLWPWVYLNHATLKEADLQLEKVAEVVRDWLAGRGYIEAAFTREDLASVPDDAPAVKKAVALAYRPDRCGDVIAIPKPGVLVTLYKGGTSHSTPHAYDAHVPFLVMGPGVPSLGKREEKVSSLQVAPTLAWALRLPRLKDARLDPPDALLPKK
ncbi:MAG: alkaline phosphatase family protein, partial [Gemmataceae bacterium]|nr:alkaline phosphatase family protein [Gemmataceae bacterium]